MGFLRWLQDILYKVFNSPESVVLLLGAIAAIWGTIIIARTTRRRGTIEYLMRSIWDEDYIQAKALFNTMATRPESFIEMYRRASGDPPSQQDYDLEARQAYVVSTTPPPSDEEAKIIARVREFKEAREQQEKIRSVLNHFELLAIGIREGILDERIFRRWYQTGFIRDWEAVAEFVRHLRKDPKADRSKAFIEIEDLATRWQSEGPLKQNVSHYKLGRRRIVVSRSH